MTSEEKAAKIDSLLKKWMKQWQDSYRAENPDLYNESDMMRVFLHAVYYGLYKYPMDRGIDVSIPNMSTEDIETIYSIR